MIAVSHAGHGRRAGLWLVAAFVALFAHLALAAVVMTNLRAQDDEDDLGAPGIEIAFELAAPQTPSADLPAGAESEASAASSAVAEQKESEQAEEQPELPQAETAELPPSVRTPERADDKELEQVPRVEMPAEQSVAQEAAAPVHVQTPVVAARATTVEQGDGQALQHARVTWQKELLAHLSKYKRYPADRAGKAADIVVAMRLDRTGRVVSARVVRTSGDEAFDRAALRMVERASPVPVPPPLVADQGLEFSLPIRFRKKGG